MGIEGKDNKYEIGTNEAKLPEQLKGISNEKDFIDIYDKLKSWYGEIFSDNEFSIIKEIRNRGCKEYGGSFNKTKLAILGNRIDFSIFEFRYTNFIDIDKNIIRKISDAYKQRGFREIALKLIKKYNNLYDSDIKIIKSEFSKAFSNNTAPNFDLIDKKISNNKGNQYQNNNDGIPNQNDNFNEKVDNYDENNNSSQINYNNSWPSDADVEAMQKLTISSFFQEIKKEIFNIESFDQNGNKKYVEGFFNECAKDIYELYGDIKDYSELKEELLPIFKQHLYAISQGIEKSSNELTNAIRDKIIDIKPDDSLSILADNAFDKNDKIDYSKYAKESELTQEEKDTIDYLFSKLSGSYPKEDVTNQYYKYKHLENKINNGQNLSEKEERDYKRLKELFQQTKRLKKLEEIKNLELSKGREYKHRSIYSSVEYATGNIKDIEPMAIVENNEKIKKYIYGDEKTQKELDTNSIKLSNEDKKRLFKELKGQKKGDFTFSESIKYLNDDLTINEDLVNLGGINMQSVINNQKKIENMIEELAAQENLNKSNKDTIKQINIRRSTMICCFRAISKFFDTVNNNGENFASEFEISDVNKDINFDETTGELTMEGVIGPNKNHIKLYYDTTTGTLEFDNFLAYDSETSSYKIGQGNGEKEKINITLPTMDQMIQHANSINLNLIDRLAPNMQSYGDIVGTVITESVRINCFKGFMGSDMEVNKSFVKQFNEKNILKQDIINNIYSKFYSQNDIKKKLESCLVINEGNEPEQFKLIKLISDTIDDYDSSNKLLRFRNAINELDNILTNNPELVNKDPLLQYLFADNLNDDSDRTDTSNAIMSKENEDLAIDSSTPKNATYESDKKYKYNGNKTLSIKLFFDLLTESKGNIEIINLDWLEATLNTIKNTGKHLLDDKQSLLWKNYEKQKGKDFPDFTELETTQKETAQELKHLEKDVKISNEFEPQIEQAYT